MKVLIIEDERPAAEKLEHYLKQYDAETEVLARLESVGDALEWLQEKQAQCDLILMDIHLSDGLALEIMQKVKITKPVIFTTAYDEYAIDAFKLNSISYLLKPITYSALSEALQKLDSLKAEFQNGEKLASVAKSFQPEYKERFMVKMGQHIKSIPAEDIAYFYAEGRHVQLVSHEGKKYFVDFKLENLEPLLSPSLFFRTNRSFILNINAIRDILVYSGSRLKVVTYVPTEKELLVSREKVKEFKEWLEGE